MSQARRPEFLRLARLAWFLRPYAILFSSINTFGKDRCGFRCVDVLWLPKIDRVILSFRVKGRAWSECVHNVYIFHTMHSQSA